MKFIFIAIVLALICGIFLAEGFWKATIIAIPLLCFLVFLIYSTISRKCQQPGPPEPESRKKLRDHIIRYYSGEIDNFDFDEMNIFDEMESTDPMVGDITGAAWYLYDDIRKHLWFDSFDKNTYPLISVWLYLLNTGIEWQEILKDRPRFKKSAYWPFASEEDFKSFLEARPELPPFIEFYPPVKEELIYKNMEIRRFFKKSKIPKTYKELKNIMSERNEAVCKRLWEKGGFDFETSMKQLSEHFPGANVKKSLPDDSVLFLQEDGIAAKALAQIRAGNNCNTPKVKEFAKQL